MPPSPLSGGGSIVFISSSVHDVVSQYLYMDVHQTFVSSTAWDKDEPIRFWGQKAKGQVHSMTT